jgi:hypothetical protein
MHLLVGLHYDYTLPKGVERHATGNYGILDDDPGAQGRSATGDPLEDVALGDPEAGRIWDARTDAVQGLRVKRWSGGNQKRLVRVGKDAAQPFADLAHRHPGFVDEADPEH